MHHYPNDLIPRIQKYIADLPDEPKHSFRPKFPLPDQSQLERLVSEAYFASFQTEEGRRPGFRVTYACEDDLGKAFNHPNASRVRLITFTNPRPYSASEITRLAPAAELIRFLICVHESKTNKGELEIWGLLDVGENWWQFIRHETSGGMPPPSHLTLTSVFPGEVSVSSSGFILMTLKGGEIVTPTADALSSGEIANYLLAKSLFRLADLS